MADMLSASSFFNLDETFHSNLFNVDEGDEGDEETNGETPVWSAINNISSYVRRLLKSEEFLPNGESYQVHPSTVIEGDVHIGEGTTIAPGCYIQGPTVIGKNCEIRHGAYIRGDVVLGDHAVVGHATEIKHSALLEHAHAPHFSYVGDSILGQHVNLGAGTKISNLPINSSKDPTTGRRTTIKLSIDGQVYDTKLAKFGTICGDHVQTGCNTVINPGCVIGRNTWTYPNVSLSKGYYPPNSLVKLRQELVIVQKT